MEEFYALNIRAIWGHFKKEGFTFWMICGYLFVEYVRPQSIIPALDILPWGKFFVVLSLVGALADRKIKWVADAANKWMFLYLLLVVFSCFNAFYPEVSWRHFADFYGWFVVYFLIINIVNTRKRFFIFLLIFLVCAFKISLGCAKNWAMRGFAFADWGLMGPPGFFQNSGELSILMLSFGPVAYRLVSFLKTNTSKPKFYVLLAMPITAAMTVIGASSRGSQIALVVQLVLIFFRKISIRSIIVLSIVAWLGYSLLPEEQKARFADTGHDKTSMQRILYWQHGREMIKEHPMSGVGFFNFAPYYEEYFSYDMLYRHAELPHNIFIQVGTDLGVPGLIVYVMLIWRNFAATVSTRKLIRKSGNMQCDFAYSLSGGFDAAFCGFLIAGQFVTVGYYPFMWINLALVVALRNVVFSELDAAKSR